MQHDLGAAADAFGLLIVSRRNFKTGAARRLERAADRRIRSQRDREGDRGPSLQNTVRRAWPHKSLLSKRVAHHWSTNTAETNLDNT